MGKIKYVSLLLILTSCTYGKGIPVIKNKKLVCRNANTAMFFVNGILNKKYEAWDTIKKTIIPTISVKSTDIDLFYNETLGKFSDLRQVDNQLKYEDVIVNGKSFDIENPLDDKSIYSSNERFEINRVKNIIIAKDNSLIISHSQGNLFANRMCDYVGPEKLVNFQIATPSSAISKCHKEYYTFNEDPIINIVRTASLSKGFKGPLPANINVTTANGMAYPSITGYLDLTVHFAETYINNQTIRKSLIDTSSDFKPDSTGNSLTLSLYKSDIRGSRPSLKITKTLELNCKNISDNITPFKLNPLEELKGRLLVNLGLGWRLITVKSKTSREKAFLPDRKSLNELIVEKKKFGKGTEYTIGYKH